MKKYRFNLEPVLNHRRLVEETLQKDLAILKISLIDENERLITYEESRVQLLEELQQIQKEGTTTSDILLYLPFIEQVSKDIERQKKRVLELEKKVEQNLKDLLEATKNKKALQKLKEKAFKTYNQKLIKNEQDFLNEVAVSQFNRRIRPQE
ncbi:MAG: flagellar export protein FliJ [Proteobacteria bacterium]|nr:flagellar export protein FliJ [Pseudomonadota bacterium]